MSNTFRFTGHAIKRMFERNISIEEVRHTIINGEIIATYHDDTPLPSRLYLGSWEQKAIHLVAAFDSVANCYVIISVYIPDPEIWDENRRFRK